MDPLELLSGYLVNTNGSTYNVFCPTGPGGGVDPTCSPPTSVSYSPSEAPGWLHRSGSDAVMSATPSDRAELLSYASEGYSELNTAMRRVDGDISKLTTGDRERVEAVERVVAAAGKLREPQVVYRGLSLTKDEAKALTAAFRAAGSGEFSMPSLTSTSLDHEAASQFASGNVPIMLRIRARAGLYLEPFSEVSGERELLLSSRAKFRIRGVTNVRYSGHSERTITTVHLEQVS